jgi:hypothetical protein
LARLQVRIWGSISRKSWHAKWRAWFRKSGQLLPLTYLSHQNQRRHAHKILAL